MFRYSIAKLKSIRNCIGESEYIEFENSKGLYLYTDTDMRSCAEYRVDYWRALKAVGRNLRKMRDYLNDNHKST